MSVTPSTTLREAGSPPPAGRRIGRRLSATHILIAVVVILAFVLNLLVLRDRGATTLVAIAERRLAAGSTFQPGLVRLVPVDSGFEGINGLIDQDSLSGYDGWVVDRSIEAGGLVDSGSLVEPGSASGLRSMSLPVTVEHAAGGSLVPGDRIDVISVGDGQAGFVVTDVEVLDVAATNSGSIGATSGYHIVVGVGASDALRLAEALDSGSIEVLRSTGAAPAGGRGDG